ncbi:MAG: hypothetical protein DWP95_09745 [Proteobacteria bacterium]|nr:MAG: hypothetical protein DWP95_09745 [Pseudomonadota bacterium]
MLLLFFINQQDSTTTFLRKYTTYFTKLPLIKNVAIYHAAINGFFNCVSLCRLSGVFCKNLQRIIRETLFGSYQLSEYRGFRWNWHGI